MNIAFFINSILLGVGLAMDAFSVSAANGPHEPLMRAKKEYGIAGTFAFFQFLMPMTGWICVHTIVEHFRKVEQFVPWIALILLAYIGGSMILEGVRNEEAEEAPALTKGTLLVQGIATSIDALSVGFTIEDYGAATALTCSLIIAAVTFVICAAGVKIGKRFGTILSGKASILGGCILIGIGIEILIGHMV